MIPITAWRSEERNENTKEIYWEHHHIEVGHCLNETPTIKKDEHGNEYKSQKCWKSMKWKKYFAYLDENYKVIIYE